MFKGPEREQRKRGVEKTSPVPWRDDELIRLDFGHGREEGVAAAQ
jgi:hypothetical protein